MLIIIKMPLSSNLSIDSEKSNNQTQQVFLKNDKLTLKIILMKNNIFGKSAMLTIVIIKMMTIKVAGHWYRHKWANETE